MSEFEADRANRTAAHRLFQARLDQVKADLTARSIRGRMAAKAKSDALALVDEAAAVAKDNKGLIAAASAMLLAWFFRAPLLAWIAARFSSQASIQLEAANDDKTDRFEEQTL